MKWATCYEKAIRDDGSLLFPERLTHEFLAYARRTMGSYLFANQYQNEIIPEGEKKFKKEWIRLYTQLPERLLHFAFIDPAIGQQKIHDYTALVVVAVDIEKNWYVRHASRQRITPSEIIELCFQVHTKYQCSAIGIESVAFQQALAIFAHEEAQRRGVNLPVTAVPRGGDKSKEMRILSLVPRFEWGTLFLAGNQHDLELELGQFPRGSHDDICFVAGTKVLCVSGEKEIQDIQPGDIVLTPAGPDVVTNTSQRAALVFNFGPLTGTASHPIWTWGGIKKLDALTSIDDLSFFTCRELIRWASLISWSSMTSDLDGWAARDFITYLNTVTPKIGAQRPWGFIALFMSFIRARRYLKAITFTIKTAILSITALKTWSAYQLRITRNTLGETLKKCEQTWIGLDLLLVNGTNLMPESNGTKKTGNVVGWAESRLTKFAMFVEKALKLIFQQEPEFALCHANKSSLTEKNQTLSQSNASYVERDSKDANELKLKHVRTPVSSPLFAPVYNIRTEKHHLFYANGILVSNCDALASIEDIVHYPSPLRRKNEQPNPNDPRYEEWFRRNLFKRAGTNEKDF